MHLKNEGKLDKKRNKKLAPRKKKAATLECLLCWVLYPRLVDFISYDMFSTGINNGH